MNTQSIQIIVIGRFPPPNDGQAMATARFVESLRSYFDITTINTTIAASASIPAKIKSYRRSGRELRLALARIPEAIVVWQSISPEALGHFRDLLTIYPALNGRKVIAVAHWGKFASIFVNKLSSSTARHLVRRLTKVVFTDVALSNDCANWLSSSQRHVISNSIDGPTHATNEEITLANSECPRSPFRILFLSNMVREKGYLDLLEAVFRLKDDGFSFNATFAGAWQSDDDRKEFEQRVRQREASDVVEHLGPIADRSKIKSLYLNADVFVLPSYLKEAQPLSIAEALNSGTPAIVANEGGMPSMIEGNLAGRAIPSRRPEEIQKAVIELSNPVVWNECSRSARSIYMKRFSAEVVRTKWVELIVDVANTEQ